jgi:2'-5' RNA ligase
MAFPVVAYFDAATEAKVNALRASLPDPTTDATRDAMQVRPHITLASWEELDVAPFVDGLGTFATSTGPLTLELEVVGTFPNDKAVVFIAPRVTAELLHLHARFHARLGGFGTEPNPYYLPGNWIPHCTIAIYLADDEVAAVVEACRKSSVFGSARLEEIALLEYPPVRQICTYRL